MIVCPDCHHHDIAGALFCSECGTQLNGVEGLFAHTRCNRMKLDSVPLPLPRNGLSLHILDAGKTLPLAGREEYTLGRSSEGQTILPDVDLSTYRAFEKGVSRLHASLKLSGGGADVTDLGSVNGTRINGKKIAPNRPQPVCHGDIITLGKLQVQVLTRR